MLVRAPVYTLTRTCANLAQFHVPCMRAPVWLSSMRVCAKSPNLYEQAIQSGRIVSIWCAIRASHPCPCADTRRPTWSCIVYPRMCLPRYPPWFTCPMVLAAHVFHNACAVKRCKRAKCAIKAPHCAHATSAQAGECGLGCSTPFASTLVYASMKQ
ncbi:hypothetical protein HanIR_Chr01g0044931 [Helianthus annuus]|nr:hypothetical protein HanIR_Chr01g0044931 [Helianthus annuus]